MVSNFNVSFVFFFFLNNLYKKFKILMTHYYYYYLINKNGRSNSVSIECLFFEQ